MVKLVSGSYLKAEHVKEGSEVMFVDEGHWVTNERFPYPDGKPRQDFMCKIRTNGQEYLMRINKTNRTQLCASWTDETQKWIGKKATVKFVDTLIGGKMMKIIILMPIGVVKQEEVAWDEDK